MKEQDAKNKITESVKQVDSYVERRVEELQKEYQKSLDREQDLEKLNERLLSMVYFFPSLSRIKDKNELLVQTANQFKRFLDAQIVFVIRFNKYLAGWELAFST